MLNKKYVGDYRLENKENKKGKMVTKAVYKSAYFVFEKPEEEVKNAVRAVTVLTAAAAVAFAVAIVFYSNKGFSAQYYTLIPFALCVFPLLYLCFAVYSLNKFMRGTEHRATREQKDKMYERLAKSSFIIMLLSGWNICGIILAFILKNAGQEARPVTTNDIIFAIMSIIFFTSAVLSFSFRKKVSMRQE